MKRRLPHLAWWVYPLGLVIIYTAITTTVVAFKLHNFHPPKQSAGANKAFEYICKKDDKSSIGCFQKKYADLTQAQGVAAAFTELKQDYANNPTVKNDCHQITHAIGRQAAYVYKSVEAAYDHGDNFCWSGYYHGVMESLVKDVGKDNINNNLTTICANVAKTRPQSFYHFNCVHGLGHGLMAINDDELFSSLHLCDKFSDSWQQESCQGGVFMENIMASINSDDTTKYLKQDDPLYPCTAVDDRYKTQCYLMQTSQALRVVGNDYAKVFTLCSTVGVYEATCYESLGRDASGNSNSSVAMTLDVCNTGTTELAVTHCLIGAVKDFISYYHSDSQANELCAAAPANVAALCQETKESYYKLL